jgi:hypothetical protein
MISMKSNAPSALSRKVTIRAVGAFLLTVALASYPFLYKLVDTARFTSYDAIDFPQYNNPLLLNPNCTMFRDVVGIYHHADRRTIRVVVQGNLTVEGRKPCLLPYLIGRLSGPAIGLVHRWSLRQTANETIIDGEYSVPIRGTYFLEIVVIHCNTYDTAKLTGARHSDEGDTSNETRTVFEVERLQITQQCVEWPADNRLTALNTSIVVTRAATTKTRRKLDFPQQQPPLVRGFWIRNQSIPIRPLYTRYQDEACFEVEDVCFHPSVDLTRFDTYQFMWTLPSRDDWTSSDADYSILNEGTLLDALRVRADMQANDTTICLFGDSHSRELQSELRKLVRSQVLFLDTYFASDLSNITGSEDWWNFTSDEPHIRHKVKEKADHTNCSTVVLGLGSWDASYHMRGRPTTLTEYERRMVKAVQYLNLAFPSAQVMLWHTRPMALGRCTLIVVYIAVVPPFPHVFVTLAAVTWRSCPPFDFRNPAMIDHYNDALKRVVARLDNPLQQRAVLLDTDFITRPMWDSPADFYHYENEAGRIEALYIAACIFGLLR